MFREESSWAEIELKVALNDVTYIPLITLAVECYFDVQNKHATTKYTTVHKLVRTRTQLKYRPLY